MPSRLTFRIPRVLLALATSLAATPLAFGADATTPLGDPPPFAKGPIAAVPNRAAIGTVIWAPRLADGFVPTAVTTGGGYVWVAARQTQAPGPGASFCFVFQVDPGNGGVAGQFSLPTGCRNPTGLAYTGDGTLWASQGNTLFRIETRGALAAGQCVEFACRTIRLAPPLLATVIAAEGDALWVGGLQRGNARLWRVPVQSIADRADLRAPISSAQATRSVAIPADATGATFGPDGTLWIASGTATTGTLRKFASAGGDILGRWAIPPAAGSVAFGPQGQLWAASGAGARAGESAKTFFPVVYALDVTKLD